MAKLDPNNIIGVLHGKISDLVFARLKNGGIYVRRVPVREAAFTAREIANHELFRRATAYVRRTAQSPIT